MCCPIDFPRDYISKSFGITIFFYCNPFTTMTKHVSLEVGLTIGKEFQNICKHLISKLFESKMLIGNKSEENI